MCLAGLALGAPGDGASAASAHQGPRPYRRAMRRFLCRRPRQGDRQACRCALHVGHGRGRASRRGRRSVLLADADDRAHRRPAARAAGRGRQSSDRSAAHVRQRGAMVLRPRCPGGGAQRPAAMAPARRPGGGGGRDRTRAPQPPVPRAARAAAWKHSDRGRRTRASDQRRPVAAEPGPGRLARLRAAARTAPARCATATGWHPLSTGLACRCSRSRRRS